MLDLMVLVGLLEDRPYVSIVDQLALVPEVVARYLESYQEKVDDLAEGLRVITSLTFAGRGRSLSAVGTCALICKEAAHFPAEGMSSAAFRHGPIQAVSSDKMLILFEGNRVVSKMHANLIADVRRFGGHVEGIGENAALEALRLPETGSLLNPVLEILPAQLVTIALSKLNNHIPGDFSVATKITKIE